MVVGRGCNGFLQAHARVGCRSAGQPDLFIGQAAVGAGQDAVRAGGPF